jgi:hypothetical protein
MENPFDCEFITREGLERAVVEPSVEAGRSKEALKR